MTVRLFLADDHQMFRQALCSLLHQQPDLEVVGQTGNGLDLVRLVCEAAPDVVCMDIRMPGIDGIALTGALQARLPQVKVVALSASCDPQHVHAMLQAGARAYVTKAEASDELLRAIRAVMGGQVYLCPDVATQVPTLAHRTRTDAVLGARERQVLRLVADGLTSAQIGAQLHIAASTVEVHRRNIMRKLNRRSVAALTRYVVDSERYALNTEKPVLRYAPREFIVVDQ